MTDSSVMVCEPGTPATARWLSRRGTHLLAVGRRAVDRLRTSMSDPDRRRRQPIAQSGPPVRAGDRRKATLRGAAAPVVVNPVSNLRAAVLQPPATAARNPTAARERLRPARTSRPAHNRGRPCNSANETAAPRRLRERPCACRRGPFATDASARRSTAAAAGPTASPLLLPCPHCWWRSTTYAVVASHLWVSSVSVPSCPGCPFGRGPRRSGEFCWS
jgi:hypothetical protein